MTSDPRPKHVPESLIGIKQIPFRIHMNDKALLYKLLEDSKINFQNFMDACVDAYLRGDPSIMKVVRDWKDLNVIPKDWKERYNLSHREREKILDEIEYMDEHPVDEDEKDDSGAD